ncbi:MAG: flagellar brake domain-containing protein [Lachnospiraceae bacterium]|nr:flagellar brake domain-containing protein [Lachnospiraceae bacterium]MDE6183974.1 flagellar brake domain-containing protein [Lachnospiraceae bacterium]MDE7287520.1 flagellar brake domain-containing protein [Lachnospiraceae bacterium]
MLSKYVMPGNRIEIQAAERVNYVDDDEKKKVYQSQVLDVVSEDRFEMRMPMEQSKLVLLPVNTEYEVFFYTSAGVYQSLATVVDRYKTENQFVLLMELSSSLSKFQRREYYRLSCALDMEARLLAEEEIEALGMKFDFLERRRPLQHNVIVDISGGGIRFVGEQVYEPESLIYCRYNLDRGGKTKEYSIIAKVLVVKKLEDKPGYYEHRAHYINIETAEREEIIRFIFEQERKNRKREKDL